MWFISHTRARALFRKKACGSLSGQINRARSASGQSVFYARGFLVSKKEGSSLEPKSASGRGLPDPFENLLKLRALLRIRHKHARARTQFIRVFGLNPYPQSTNKQKSRTAGVEWETASEVSAFELESQLPTSHLSDLEQVMRVSLPAKWEDLASLQIIPRIKCTWRAWHRLGTPKMVTIIIEIDLLCCFFVIHALWIF